MVRVWGCFLLMNIMFIKLVLWGCNFEVIFNGTAGKYWWIHRFSDMTILAHWQTDTISVRYCAEAYDNLIFHLKISCFKTEDWNVLNLTHIVISYQKHATWCVLQYTYSEEFHESHCKASVVGFIMGIAADEKSIPMTNVCSDTGDFWEYYFSRYIEEQI